MMFSKTRILLLIMLSLAVLLAGCSGDEGSTTAPNADQFLPTGTIQGILRDATTKEPIVGAVVDVGVASATTNDRGQFVIPNVPANQDADGMGNATTADAYMITIDLRGVTSPVNMADPNNNPSGYMYPEFSYAKKAVQFVSLNDSSPLDAATGAAVGGAGTVSITGTNATNHDTPVNELTASVDLAVGKLSATIKGDVIMCSTLQKASGKTLTVKLVSNACNGAACGGAQDWEDSYLGAKDNVLATQTLTNSTSFTFANVEALQNFRITAVDSTGTLFGEEEVNAPADGETKTLVAQHDQDDQNASDAGAAGGFGGTDALDNATVCIGEIDTVDVKIIAQKVVVGTTEYGDGSNIGDATAADAVWVFSEAIKQTSWTDVTNPLKASITPLVSVTYDGQYWTDYLKAGNIAYSVSWATTNVANDTLKVTVPSLAPASKYTVSIASLTDGIVAGTDEVEFKDANGEPVDVPAGGNVIEFYTTGGGTLTAPAVKLANANPVDFNDTVELDWVVSSGAKMYRVYKNCSEFWPGGATVAGQDEYVDLGGGVSLTAGTQTSFAQNFLDNDGASDIVALHCDYWVSSVGPDMAEAVDKTKKVTVQDEADPTFTGIDAAEDLYDVDNQFILLFGEPMLEGNVEATTSLINGSAIWKAGTTPPAIDSVEYASVYAAGKAVSGKATVTLDKALTWADVNVAFINSGPNGICQQTETAPGDPTGDDVSAIDSGNGSPNSICVTKVGAAATLNTDYDDGTYTAGVNGELCDSNGTAGTAGDGISTNCDDRVGGILAGPTLGTTVNSGADGICQTSADGTDTQSILVGNGSAANVKCVEVGPNGIFDSYNAGSDDAIQYGGLTNFIFMTLPSANFTDVNGNGLATDGFNDSTDADRVRCTVSTAGVACTTSN